MDVNKTIQQILKQLCCIWEIINTGASIVFGTSFSGAGTEADPKQINIFASGPGYGGGSGTETDPLVITGGGGTTPTLYTEDGTISDARTVTVDNDLTFEGGNTTNINLNVGANQYFRLGPATSDLKGLQGRLNLNYSGGLRLLRGDDTTNNYSALTMAPGTSSAPLWLDVNGTGGSSGVRIDGTGSATGINFARLEAVGSVGGLGTNAKAQLTPTEFTIQRTIGAPPDLAVFTINVNTGQVKLSTQYNNSAFLSVNSTGVVTKVNPMAAIADATDATDLLTKFNTLLAELRTAGLLAP